MSDMVCANCGRTGIAWVGPMDNPTGTHCPHCGGENCQRAFCAGDDNEYACPNCEGDGVFTDERGVLTCEQCGGEGFL